MICRVRPGKNLAEAQATLSAGKPLVSRILLVILVLSGLTCGGNAVKSTWSAGRIEIDGLPSDWRGIASNYITAPNIEYRLANDTTNLFLLLRTPDPSVPMRIVMHGLKIWVDSKSAKQKRLGVEIPSGTTPMEGSQEKQSFRDHPHDRRARAILGNHSAEAPWVLDSLINGACFIENGRKVSKAKAKGVLISAAEEEGWFLLEMRLPFDAFGIEVCKTRAVNLGIEIPGAQPPNLEKIPRPDEGDYSTTETSLPQPRSKMPFQSKLFRGVDVWLRVELETTDLSQSHQ